MIQRKRRCNHKLRTSLPKWMKENKKDLGIPMKKVLAIMYDINKVLGEKLLKGLPVVLPSKMGELQIFKVLHTRRNLKFGKLKTTGIREYYPVTFEETYAPKLVWRKVNISLEGKKKKLPFLSNYKFKLTSSWNKSLFEAITKDHKRFLDI